MITLDVWLYGPLSRFAGEKSKGSHAHLILEVAEGTRMADLIGQLGIPLDEKGITFVNADLSDMPGLGADQEMVLKDGDRIGIFHRQSMWPFQYRFGASQIPEMREALQRRQRGAICHSAADPEKE